MGNQAAVAVELALSSASYERLPGSGRALIQLALGQGGNLDVGYRAIAASLDLSEKTIELVVPRLFKAGWLHVVRRQRRPAILKLTAAAKAALAAARGLSLSATPSKAGSPSGFLGDPAALDAAQKLVRLNATATPRDFANLYLERCVPDEIARIAAMQDDYGSIPLEVATITGHERLDLGLRDRFESESRRLRSRAQLRNFMGFED